MRDSIVQFSWNGGENWFYLYPADTWQTDVYDAGLDAWTNRIEITPAVLEAAGSSMASFVQAMAEGSASITVTRNYGQSATVVANRLFDVHLEGSLVEDAPPAPVTPWEPAHAYLPLVDLNGDLRDSAQVRVTEVGATQTLPLYSDPESTVPLLNPMGLVPGIVDVWADLPFRADLEIVGKDSSGDQDQQTIEGVDFYGDPAQMARTTNPLQITGGPRDSRHILRATSDTHAYWHDYGDRNEILAGASGTVAFFGSTGAPRATIPTDQQDQTLTDLLEVLEGLGLLVVQTTGAPADTLTTESGSVLITEDGLALLLDLDQTPPPPPPPPSMTAEDGSVLATEDGLTLTI